MSKTWKNDIFLLLKNNLIHQESKKLSKGFLENNANTTYRVTDIAIFDSEQEKDKHASL